ncbi:hypothetical protein [Bacillus toyonensis]|uniref:hypothetical protein n=1 Tax=Bacillus toyonensis TaxID=155322 RepID=UPI00211F1E3A|nr:hypothetical protein [Bacillus toyonensis]
MATCFILAGGTGFASAAETYPNVYNIDCGKTVPTAWYKTTSRQEDRCQIQW